MDALAELSLFYDQIQDCVAVFDQSNHVIYCNDAFSTFTGYSIVRYLNKSVGLSSAIKSLDGEIFKPQQLIDFATEGGARIMTIETKQVLRGLVHIAVSPFLISKEEKENKYYLLSLKDVTAEEEMLQSFRREIENHNKKMLEMNQLIEILQKIRLIEEPASAIEQFINSILMTNKVYLAITSHQEKISVIQQDKGINTENSRIKKNGEQLVLLNDEGILNHIQQYLRYNKITKYISLRSEIQSFDNQFFHWSATPFKLGKNSFFAIFIFESNQQKEEFSHQSVIILSDQLNLILNNLTLKEFATTDGLTKLKNSSYFRDKLDEMCQQKSRGQLILFDIDFFKKVNDTYGHPCGDAVLIILGEQVQNSIEQFSKDLISKIIVARIGGEEFAIFIPDVGVHFATDLAEKIRTDVEKLIVKYDQSAVNFTISMGLSSWNLSEGFSEKAVKNLYRTADEALYKSKKSGRNQLSIYRS